MINFCWKTNAFLKRIKRQQKKGGLAILGFLEICDFAVCAGIFCTFAYSRGLFSVIFLHFLQKYRCVPKIAFSADISIDIFVDIPIDMFIDISTGISIDMFLQLYLHVDWHVYWHLYWRFSWHSYWHFCWHFDWQGRKGRRREWTSC